LIQYPLKKYYSFICRIAHLKKAKTITLIHDLGSFRRQKLTVLQEIKRLNRSRYIIAHNTSMQKWLQDNGLSVPCGCLEIFDYLSPEPTPERLPSTSQYKIVYAGALSPRKNQFLYQIGKFITDHRIHLYGTGFEPDLAQGKEHFDYKGFIPSDRLIREVQGDFGLVWDGNSVSACSGDWGYYLQYNNPHKTSLYIRCELPVIIWKKAALASFVKDNGIGICVDSLEELNDILNHLSPEDIINMKQNIKSVSQRLSVGYYTQSATRTAIEKLSS
ncbi:MAG: galactofuranosyltransferase, partial [Odoribacter sp.]|nr:galactofuranosyltransferase [Odoribacter sp.]